MKILQLLDETSKAAIIKNIFVDYLVIDKSKITINIQLRFFQYALVNSRAYERGTKNHIKVKKRK